MLFRVSKLMAVLAAGAHALRVFEESDNDAAPEMDSTIDGIDRSKFQTIPIIPASATENVINPGNVRWHNDVFLCLADCVATTYRDNRTIGLLDNCFSNSTSPCAGELDAEQRELCCERNYVTGPCAANQCSASLSATKPHLDGEKIIKPRALFDAKQFAETVSEIESLKDNGGASGTGNDDTVNDEGNGDVCQNGGDGCPTSPSSASDLDAAEEAMR